MLSTDMQTYFLHTCQGYFKVLVKPYIVTNTIRFVPRYWFLTYTANFSNQLHLGLSKFYHCKGNDCYDAPLLGNQSIKSLTIATFS